MPQNALIAVRNAVRATLVAALGGVPVELNRRRAIAQGNDRFVVVRLSGSDPSEGAILGAPVDWITDVAVEAYARDDDTDDAETRAMALHGTAYAALHADSTLGGVVDHVAPPRFGVPDIEELDDDLACVVAIYSIEHRTAANVLDV